MKLNTLFNQERPVFSLEIFPPKKTAGMAGMTDMIAELCTVKTDFISVTYGAGASRTDNKTAEIASSIKGLGVESMAHLTCVNSEKSTVLDVIDRLKQEGIENILALRGDINADAPVHDDFIYASDLVKVINQNGDFNIAGACYPEGHYQNKNLSEDITNLKYKIDAGVTHLITQLFFDNSSFYKFMAECRSQNIIVPVQAGIMPITASRQISRTVALSGASLPPEFTKMINKYNGLDEDLFEAGIEYASAQIIDLIQNGVDGIHLYAMNNPTVVKRIYQNIKPYLGGA